MLYHVRLKPKSTKWPETKLDLSEDQLRLQVLEPYEQGRPIVLNGKTIPPDDIERVQVSCSDVPGQNLVAQMKAEDRASNVARHGGYSYEYWAAAKARDITDEVIMGPPGYRGTAATEGLVKVVEIEQTSGDLAQLMAFRVFVNEIRESLGTPDERSRLASEYQRFVRPLADSLGLKDPGETNWHSERIVYNDPVERAIKHPDRVAFHYAVPYLDRLIGATQSAGDPTRPQTPLFAGSLETKSASPSDPRKVFVVHGRDAKARDGLFTFLRSIGLRPVEWSEAVAATRRASPYIGDILDKAFEIAQAVVVLMTPDDLARLQDHFHQVSDPPHEKELSGQARPNVLFEAGMAMGRDPERTVLVEMGQLRPFSDVGGRHVLRMDGSSQKRQDLAKRLESAGCPVDLAGTDWHTSGDLSLTVGQKPAEKS